MRMILKRFRTDRRGATAIEYGLIVAVLSLAMVAGFGRTTNALNNMWLYAANTIEDSAK